MISGLGMIRHTVFPSKTYVPRAQRGATPSNPLQSSPNAGRVPPRKFKQTIKIKYATNSKKNNNMKMINVAPTGIEPISAEPKSVVLTFTPQGIQF